MNASFNLQDTMRHQLSDIWEKSRGTLLDRVAVIEAAVRSLRVGSLDVVERAQAERAAHKIAGVAGTFGYWDATNLAREAEAAFEGNAPIGPEVGRRLGEIAAALREQLTGAPPRRDRTTARSWN